MERVLKLTISYDGTAYVGWQRQAEGVSIQGLLEEALARLDGAPVAVHGAGRTDAGVHALGQVASARVATMHDPAVIRRALNAMLPGDVRVLGVEEAPDDFHARYSALSRTYLYRVVNRRMRPALERSRACWIRRPLDEAAMHRAAQQLLGERDFSSFRAAECQSSTPMRHLMEAEVVRRGEVVQIRVRANAFLHHMVRNIAGSLLLVGGGDRPEAWLAEALEARDRTRAGPTAPPQGLYFAGVEYPAGFGLPCAPRGSGRLGAGPSGDPP